MRLPHPVDSTWAEEGEAGAVMAELGWVGGERVTALCSRSQTDGQANDRIAICQGWLR